MPHTIVKNADRQHRHGGLPRKHHRAVYGRSCTTPSTIEVLRGCTRGCRFCPSGHDLSACPRSAVWSICSSWRKLVDSTGYEEITLSSLPTGDYTPA